MQPEVCFTTVALLFGVIFLLLVPPFQTPDEINHFYRAYQIADGDLLGQQQDHRVGGEIPESLVWLAADFRPLTWRSHDRITKDTIVKRFDIPLNPQQKRFVDFANTAMYSPVSYIPSALGIFILKPFEPSPLTLFYAARLMTLLCWIFGIYWSIRSMPFYKWVFAFAALLPMSVFINASISADVVTNVLAFVSIAYVLKLAYEEPTVSIRHLIMLCLLAVLLASAKIVYTPVLAVALLIPYKKFGSRTRQFIQLSLLAIIALIAALFWSKVMKDLYIPYEAYHPEFRDDATLVSCANMYEQTAYILSHGSYVFKVFYNSMIHTFDMYYEGFIGTFGWLDTHLPLWFIPFSYAVLLLVLLLDGKKEIRITLLQKAILFFSCLLMLFLILLSQHLTWDCVGGDIIATIQGRYFIPAAPVLFLLFYTSRFSRSQWVGPLVMAFALFSLGLSVNVLYSRYYKEETIETTIIRCGAEETAADNLFKTNLPEVFLENANTQSKEKVRSGLFAVKVNAKDPYTFTYRPRNCERGDQLIIDVWRLGPSGLIAFSDRENDIFVTNSQAQEKDSAGWEHVQLNYTIVKDMKGKEVIIYFNNDARDTTYFDDLTITHRKFN